MNLWQKLMDLNSSSWFFVILLAIFLYLVLAEWFRTRSDIVSERIEKMEVFSTGTEEEKTLQKSLFQRIYLMAEERTVRYLDRYMKSGKMRPLKIKLIQANDHVTEPIQHWAKKIICGALMAFVGLIAFQSSVHLIVLFTVLGVYFPDYQLKKKIEKRQLKIKSELPDFLDLLAATAPSAKSLEDAIKKVCQRMTGDVTLEFTRALEEINTGRRRRDALNDFAVRCGVTEVHALVSQINQAEVFGTGVEKTLLNQAEKIRKLKKTLAEIKAKKAKITLLLPSMFLLLTGMIMIVGPHLVTFMGSMKMFGG